MPLRRREVKEEPEVFDLSPQDSDEVDVRISVSKELREHYDKVIEHRDGVLGDSYAENKDVAAILGATTTILKELAKIQEGLYNSEKYAVFQQALIGVIKEMDPEAADLIVERLDALDFSDEKS